MKKILITQRVDYISSYDEHRDALDHQWIPLILAAEVFPVLVANNLTYVKQMLALDQFDGLLLTGGNSLVDYGGDSIVRDGVEKYLLNWAIRFQLPVMGVCRGMQLVQHYYQTPLQEVPDHVGVKKQMQIVAGDRMSDIYSELGAVRTFHRQGSYVSRSPLKTIATSKEGVVMAIRHESLPIHGVMWHPERERDNSSNHIEVLRTIFDGRQ